MLPEDFKDATASQTPWGSRLHQTALMQDETDWKVTTAQRRYKHHHSQFHCATASFKDGQRVYVDGPLLTVNLTVADWLATYSYSKPLPRELGPCCITSAAIKNLTVDEDRLPNTTSLDPASLASQWHEARLRRVQMHYNNPNKRRVFLENTLRKTCPWILLGLSARPFWVLLEPQKGDLLR